ncbi:hypothetical protein [Bradyrhizobium sp. DASA03007]|uniref:hypothetical protein n=1 Tax=unclassified Bradyrhizobium TaxID=2631580 RepID=UPI003F6EF365
MDRRRLLLGAAGLLVGGGASAQSAADAPELAGKWTYRSFHNRPALVDGDPQKALRLIFAEAVFTFQTEGNSLKGGIDWEGGGLDLAGTIQPATATTPLSVAIVGSGRPKTNTDGWEYDYRAALAYRWPNGVDQLPALVGSVIRAKPHNGAPAGYVASFIAVRQS